MLFIILNQMTIKVLFCNFRQKYTKRGLTQSAICGINIKVLQHIELTFFGNTDLEEKRCLIKPV